MEQMQSESLAMPHIVQVYQSTASTNKIQNPQIIHISHPPLDKLTYQQTIKSETLHNAEPIEITEYHHQNLNVSQSLVMSCQQAHLQTLQTPITSQVLQSSMQSDMSQRLQITSHVILPSVPVFDQQVLVNGVHNYFGHYEPINKEPCVDVKVDSIRTQDVKLECQPDKGTRIEKQVNVRRRHRNPKANPDLWASNIRKQKHQKGESYISRRGKLVPEKQIRNFKDCLNSCKYRCSERISDSDRELIFKAFYSLNKNEKKHFLLNTTERNNTVKYNNTDDVKRKYSFKYFFLIRAVRYTVCKKFYLGTLSISQKPVYSVHLMKSDYNIPKPDGRGLSQASCHALPQDMKETVRKHIMSFQTINYKPIKQYSNETQYLESSLTIKKMYTMYVNMCSRENLVSVKESMYRKILKEEFNLHFRKVKGRSTCCKCKGNVKKK